MKKYCVIGLLFLIGILLFVCFVKTPNKPVVLSLIKSTVFTSVSSSKNIDNRWTLIATGDVIPARSVNYKTILYNDFTWSWKYIAPLLRNGDITLINLESPLIKNCPVVNDGFTFCGDQRHIEGIVYAGVDVVGLANNHMGNYFIQGIEETKQLLENNMIDVIGLNNQRVIKEVKGIKVGFLAYNDIGVKEEGIAWVDTDMMQEDIRVLKNQTDVVIVSMSWGEEYTASPSSRQKELAHFIIDNGGDLIIGNHPHWIQSTETYKGKFIMYAHGNTIFDQMWSEETKTGVIGKYIFSGSKLIRTEFIPTYIEDYGQPKLLEGEAKEKILQGFVLPYN